MKQRKFYFVLMMLVMVLASAVPAFAGIPAQSDSFYVADYADVISDETEAYIVEKKC